MTASCVLGIGGQDRAIAWFFTGAVTAFTSFTGSRKAKIPASIKIMKFYPLAEELLAIDGCWRRRNRFLQDFCLGKPTSTHIGSTQY